MKRLIVSLIITMFFIGANNWALKIGFDSIGGYRDISACTATVEGIVISPVEGETFESRVDSHHSAIARYEVNDNTYKCEVSRTEKPYFEGESVTLVYNPENPSKAFLEADKEPVQKVCILGIGVMIGTVIFAIVLGIVISGFIFKLFAKKAETRGDTQ